jgi:hypothetical protein
MPFIEKIKSKTGKSLLKTRKNLLTGKEMVISKDVEYKTSESPRTVYKNVEVIDKEGTTSYMKLKKGGKVVRREKVFTPKAKINIGPSNNT